MSASNRGFSLVELMVAAGVSVVIALGMSMLTINSMKAQNNVMLTAGIDDFSSLVSIQAGDANGCFSLLGGTVVGGVPQGNAATTLSTTPQATPAATLAGLPALTAGVVLQSSVIQNLSALPLVAGTTTWPAQLMFTFNKNAGNVIGALTTTRTVPLAITTPPWNGTDPTLNIIGCQSGALSPQQLCTALGGTYSAGPPVSCTGAITSGPTLWNCTCPGASNPSCGISYMPFISPTNLTSSCGGGGAYGCATVYYWSCTKFN